jgi:hypothetical protein
MGTQAPIASGGPGYIQLHEPVAIAEKAEDVGVSALVEPDGARSRRLGTAGSRG